MRLYEVKTEKILYTLKAKNSNKLRKKILEKENISYRKIKSHKDVTAYNLFWQRDDRYGGIKIGKTNTNIRDYGCAIMCFSFIAKRDPLEINKLFTKEKVYFRDEIIFKKACKVLGFKNYERNTNIGRMPKQEETIKEVYLGKSKHFVVRFNKGGKRWIFDPWTGNKKSINFYRFRSYRIFDK